MADDEHALVLAPQQPVRKPPPDPVGINPQRQQLLPGDTPLLPIGSLRDDGEL